MKEYTRQKIINFAETFSLVAKMTIVQVLLALAIAHSWTIYQMDVKNAFLQEDLFEKVFMQLPLSFTEDVSYRKKGLLSLFMA